MSSYDFDVIGDTPQPRHANARKSPMERAPAEKAPTEKDPARTAMAEEPVGPIKKRDEAA